MVLIKNTSRAVTNWALYDSMRGIVTDGDDYVLAPNSQQADAAPVDIMTLTGIGRIIGISRDRVRNLERDGLRGMRSHSEAVEAYIAC